MASGVTSDSGLFQDRGDMVALLAVDTADGALGFGLVCHGRHGACTWGANFEVTYGATRFWWTRCGVGTGTRRVQIRRKWRGRGAGDTGELSGPRRGAL